MIRLIERCVTLLRLDGDADVAHRVTVGGMRNEDEILTLFSDYDKIMMVYFIRKGGILYERQKHSFAAPVRDPADRGARFSRLRLGGTVGQRRRRLFRHDGRKKIISINSLHRMAVIEPGVTYIGREAFYCCKKLKTVTIADTVTGIGTWAFAYCEKLPSIVVPDSVTDLGYAIFDHCKALTLARLPEQVDSMSTSLFSNCENLTKVNIPRNATAVQEYMFQNCKSLTDIRIPDSVTKIGQYAFQNCETFLDMDLPANLTEIGQFAFDGCCNLRYINIPDGVKRFEGYVFRGCSQLKNIHIPDGTTLIGGRAFMDCASLQSVTLPDSVTAVNFGAFCGCSSLTRIDIPSGVAAVSASAFKDCTALTEATFHTGLKRIRENAFENCTALCAAAIPAGTELIGDSAFYRCTSLTDVSIPDSVTTIGDLAFSETPWRESFPDGLVIVCNGVLNYCGDCPAEVTIPDGTAHIWGGAFQNKTTLQKINIPASVQYIGGYSFDGCAALTDITLPEGVNAVKRCTFQNCTSLREIVIPESITPNPSDYEGNETKELQYKCFAGCTALEYVYLPDCLPYLGWHQEFDGCTALKNLTLPKNTRLQHSRFYKNMNLKLSRVLFVDPTHDPSAYTSSDSTEGVTFYRIDTSGDCALSYDDFTLTVSGEGAMANYTASKPAPWGYFPDFRTRVTSIVSPRSTRRRSLPISAKTRWTTPHGCKASPTGWCVWAMSFTPVRARAPRSSRSETVSG